MASRLLSRTLLSRTLLSRPPLLRTRVPLRPSPFLRKPPTSRPTSTSAPSPSPSPSPSLSQRLKALSKEYGYSAIGVYFALSALDFPFCFLAVRYLGAERVGRWEDVAVGFLKPYWTGLRRATGFPAQQQQQQQQQPEKPGEQGEREEKSASVWTELALAYAVHKSFIFLRVPLTAAVTPKVVKVLRGWGWNIGRKGKAKPKTGTSPPSPV